MAKCASPPGLALGRRLFSDASEWPAIASISMVDDSDAAPGLSCFTPAPRDVPWVAAHPDLPCSKGPAEIGDSARQPCGPSESEVRAELAALGKPGWKIARAREEVLKILDAENACSEWFRTRDRAPAETFRSLDFSLDLQGPPDVLATILGPSIAILRQPYVAKATQDGGPHTTITINAYGAFYRPQGQVENTVKEGGPMLRGGTHVLTVGSFTGDTLPAQVVTLLHEFGHIIDLLPEDADDLDGKSARNTSEVLRHCQAEIAARALEARHK